MSTTTAIIQLSGFVLLTTGYVYRSGGWRRYLQILNRPYPSGIYQAFRSGEIRPGPRWTRALFWLGLGLWLLGLWRQWSGV
jgi:hypothetical protein